MIRASFVHRLLEGSVPIVANLSCAEEQDQITSWLFKLQLRRGQICAEEACGENKRERPTPTKGRYGKGGSETESTESLCGSETSVNLEEREV